MEEARAEADRAAPERGRGEGHRVQVRSRRQESGSGKAEKGGAGLRYKSEEIVAFRDTL